ncbi:MAG: polysaccharide deacetylase family protein [Firmicutes bacterium]|nr:polysaccharide deacetylase family protein [Bacillota bacterium]
MKIFFLGQKQLRLGIYLFIILVLIAGLFLKREEILRDLFGVKPGVSLEGHLVSRLLPEEVTRLVKGLAAKIDRAPRNASYFRETGEIIPSVPGIAVDIAGTVTRVCSARPGSNLRLIVRELPAAVSEDFFKAVYSGDKTKPRAALAINVAWGEEFVPAILDILAREKAKASFFFVGTWAKSFPEMVRKIMKSGHELANHGFFHGHPLQMNRVELRKMILDNAALLEAITGKKPAPLFSPPYGELNPLVVNVAAELGYRTIMWSVDSLDWKNPTPEILLERVLGKIQPGGIILLHPTIATKTALADLIRGLRKKGLEPGTVSEAL